MAAAWADRRQVSLSPRATPGLTGKSPSGPTCTRPEPCCGPALGLEARSLKRQTVSEHRGSGGRRLGQSAWSELLGSWTSLPIKQKRDGHAGIKNIKLPTFGASPTGSHASFLSELGPSVAFRKKMPTLQINSDRFRRAP